MSRQRLELLPADRLEVVLKDKGDVVFKNNEIIGFIQKAVTDFGNGAKISFTKEYLNRKVYVVVCR